MAPELSADAAVTCPSTVDVIFRHDARHMEQVESGSVALVVTSPPYFAGKEYEESLGRNGVPATYFEYLALLRDVFLECRRVLEPGGRIAVNVANLGRRPYRSLAGDVTGILQDLGLLLRGEVVWWKGKAAGGSCAWGSFQSPANPVLRDVTERVVIASKGRFDRALNPAARRRLQLPADATISRDEFLEATTDLWEIQPERAGRVGHPAPFPVELPRRLIELYTYRGDVVLDPFVGSGSTAVAAAAADRRYIGFDTDESYVELARRRVLAVCAARYQTPLAPHQGASGGASVAACSGGPPPDEPRPDGARSDGARSDGATVAADELARAVAEGRQAKDVAAMVLAACGFREINSDVNVARLGLQLPLTAVDAGGGRWAFDVAGLFTTTRTGLRRGDSLWRVLGRAAVLHQGCPDLPLVVLTTDLPVPASAGARALGAVSGPGRPVRDAVELLDPAGHRRLAGYAAAGGPG